MILSHSKRFLFVHIFKTASTSVAQVLLPYARWVDRVAYSRGRLKRAIQLCNRLAGLQHNGLQHITGFHKFASAREIRDKLGAEAFRSYYSFSFVRNPFDWVVSAYFHLRRLEEHPLHGRASTLSFPEFVRHMLDEQPRRMLDSLVDEKGEILVDAVGRMETLEADLARICGRLGIPFHQVPHENAAPGRSRDHRRHYDDETRELLAAWFAPDLERFGYDFDGVRDPVLPCRR